MLGTGPRMIYHWGIKVPDYSTWIKGGRSRLRVVWFSQQRRCCSVTKSCLTLCDPMDCSMPGFPVLHYTPKLAQTPVHWVGDANTFQDFLQCRKYSLALSSCGKNGKKNQIANIKTMAYVKTLWLYFFQITGFFAANYRQTPPTPTPHQQFIVVQLNDFSISQWCKSSKQLVESIFNSDLFLGWWLMELVMYNTIHPDAGQQLQFPSATPSWG